MKFTDLDPQFMRIELRTTTWTRVLGDPLVWKAGDPTEQVTGEREYHINVDTLAEAQGVRFTCPKCNSHSLVCWFKDRGVPDSAVPGPGRWVAAGTGYADFSASPSILLTSGCRWHGYVTNGNVTSC